MGSRMRKEFLKPFVLFCSIQLSLLFKEVSIEISQNENRDKEIQDIKYVTNFLTSKNQEHEIKLDKIESLQEYSGLKSKLINMEENLNDLNKRYQDTIRMNSIKENVMPLLMDTNDEIKENYLALGDQNQMLFIVISFMRLLVKYSDNENSPTVNQMETINSFFSLILKNADTLKNFQCHKIDIKQYKSQTKSLLQEVLKKEIVPCINSQEKNIEKICTIINQNNAILNGMVNILNQILKENKNLKRFLKKIKKNEIPCLSNENEIARNELSQEILDKMKKIEKTKEINIEKNVKEYINSNVIRRFNSYNKILPTQNTLQLATNKTILSIQTILNSILFDYMKNDIQEDNDVKNGILNKNELAKKIEIVKKNIDEFKKFEPIRVTKMQLKEELELIKKRLLFLENEKNNMKLTNEENRKIFENAITERISDEVMRLNGDQILFEDQVLSNYITKETFHYYKNIAISIISILLFFNLYFIFLNYSHHIPYINRF